MGRTQTNVYFVHSQSSWVLIDAGWANDGPRIKRAAESLVGREAPPVSILLTNCHPDPSGAARYLAQRWRWAVYMHRDELPIATGDFATMQALAGPLDRWVIRTFMRVIGRRRRKAILADSSLGQLARAIEPGAGVPGLAGWECIPTPGQTPGEPSRRKAVTDRMR